MGCDDHAETFGEFESLKHLAVIDAKKVFVSEENLEGGSTVGNDFAQLRFGSFHELGNRHVEGIIAGTLAVGFGFPKLITLQRIVSAIGAAHFDVRGSAADEPRNAGGFVGIFGKSRHERQINVYVRVDKTWENEFSRSIDNFCFWRRF